MVRDERFCAHKDLWHNFLILDVEYQVGISYFQPILGVILTQLEAVH